MADISSGIVRTTIAVLLIGAMIGVSLWILRPFLPALIWATMTVIATWPLMLSVEKKLWDRRGLAATAMTGVFLLMFVLPVSLAIGIIVQNADEIMNWLKSLGNIATPEAPDWLKGIPYVGTRLASRWQEIAAIAPEELRSRLLPHVGTLLRWLAGQVGNLGSLLLQFLVTLAIAAVLYLRGEAAAAGAHGFARCIAGQRGEESVRLAAQAIRAVAIGVVGTAIVQSALAWIGLAIAGMPHAALFTAVVFVLALAQLGAGLVLLACVFWLWWNGEPGWAAALFLWGLVVTVSDNFLRPILIKKSGDLSLLLIFPGVIGGLIAFGFIGIFIGPVVLAVAYTLLAAWVAEADPEIHVDPLGAADGDIGKATLKSDLT
ncbi:MAG: AI-2E family transporter YdiK [Syntrophobacteraceae bacterium]